MSTNQYPFMKTPVTPNNEDLRLKDLYSFKILDTDNEQDFDDLAALVTEVCGCPIASITFIDKDRQWFKAKINIENSEGSREDSFCGHTILEKEILLVNDASQDERFFDNPDVIGGLKIGFYAGVPIISSSGYALGAVCAIDNSPRELTAQQIQALQRIARQVSRLLDLRLKNEKMLEMATQLVQAEKKIAQLNIAQREEENFQTANILHEDIAQTSAAVRLYMDMARNGNDLTDTYIDRGIDELMNLTRAVTGLAKSITPTTFHKDNYTVHIAKLVADFKKETTVKITLHQQDELNELTGHTGLMVFRLVQDLLKLARCCQSKEATLTIKVNDGLDVSFIYNGFTTISGTEKLLLERNISNRVDILGGSMKEIRPAAGNEFSVIRLSIPVVEVAV